MAYRIAIVALCALSCLHFSGCGCSKEKVAGALATISTEDLQEMINDGEEIEVKCYFCNSAYKYSIEELEDIMASRS